MSKADNELAQKQEHESSLYEFFVSFPPLQMMQTVLKNSQWWNALPRSVQPQTFSLKVSRPVHPNVDAPGGFWHQVV